MAQTASGADSDTLTLLQLTMIPQQSIHTSLFIAGLYRVRIALTWGIAIFPQVAAGLTFWSFVFGSPLVPYQFIDRPVLLMVIPLLVWMVILICVWGVSIAGITLGVGLGMVKRLSSQPAAASILIVVPHLTSISVVTATLMWLPYGGYTSLDSSFVLPIFICVMALTFPYLATFGILRFVHRYNYQL
jgi:hypothetical protein